MIRSFVPSFWFVLLAGVLVASFAGSVSAGDSQTLRSEKLAITSSAKVHVFDAEIAATDAERAQGLMFRTKMPSDHGMLFIFDGEGDRYFWMKNTPLPLDIIFIDASGKIVSIAANTVPYSEKVIPSGAPARFVFEINAGLSAELGLKSGDRVSSPSMALE